MGSGTEPREDGLQARLPSPQVIGQRARVFSSSRGMRRFRRASDVVVLVPAGLLLVGLIVAYPPSRLERSFASFLAAVPGWLDPVWGFAYDLLALWAIALIVIAVVTRRHVVALQVLGSVVGAGLLATVSFRLATGQWPSLDVVLRLEVDGRTFPVVRVALCAATIDRKSTRLNSSHLGISYA